MYLLPELKKTWSYGKQCPFCPFGPKGGLYKNGKTACEFFHSEIKEKGMDIVNYEYVNLDKISQYKEGGGRKYSN